MAALGLADRYVCPMLDVSPRAAIALADDLIAQARARGDRDLSLVGSSLGGYYATWLAERHGCKAVLLNPATHPYRDLANHLGDQPLWHGGGTVRVEAHHLQELLDIDVPAITRPSRYLLLAATGDEVLDYRDMLAKYPGANTRVIAGSDHGLGEFADYVDDVLAFCGLLPA
jgi:predicted esterase YcpF (UPF0227 family)